MPDFRDAIEKHWIGATPGCDIQTVCIVLGMIVDRMEEQDMPQQEIISILLPLDHTLNGTPDA